MLFKPVWASVLQWTLFTFFLITPCSTRDLLLYKKTVAVRESMGRMTAWLGKNMCTEKKVFPWSTKRCCFWHASLQAAVCSAAATSVAVIPAPEQSYLCTRCCFTIACHSNTSLGTVQNERPERASEHFCGLRVNADVGIDTVWQWSEDFLVGY